MKLKEVSVTVVVGRMVYKMENQVTVDGKDLIIEVPSSLKPDKTSDEIVVVDVITDSISSKKLFMHKLHSLGTVLYSTFIIGTPLNYVHSFIYWKLLFFTGVKFKSFVVGLNTSRPYKGKSETEAFFSLRHY